VTIRSSRFLVRTVQRALVAVLLGGAALTAANTASADATGWTVSYGARPYFIDAETTSMVVAVSQASGSAGAPLIQWYNTGGSEQKWYLDAVFDVTGSYRGYELRNQNSGMCIRFDGNPGDGLTQQPCNLPDVNELWNFSDPTWTGAHYIYSNVYGYQFDVYQNSYSAGAIIDGYYAQQAYNQMFWLIDA
jgi:hypothetical protein